MGGPRSRCDGDVAGRHARRTRGAGAGRRRNAGFGDRPAAGLALETAGNMKRSLSGCFGWRNTVCQGEWRRQPRGHEARAIEERPGRQSDRTGAGESRGSLLAPESLGYRIEPRLAASSPRRGGFSCAGHDTLSWKTVPGNSCLGVPSSRPAVQAFPVKYAAIFKQRSQGNIRPVSGEWAPPGLTI